MGRVARGVIGIRLADEHEVVSMLVLSEGKILSVTANGFGKRTAVDDHPRQGRGGQGVIGIQTSERNGPVISAIQVRETDDIMLISDGGTLVRTSVEQVSVMGRNTQGVTLIRLRNDEALVGLARIKEDSDADDDPSGEDGPPETDSD